MRLLLAAIVLALAGTPAAAQTCGDFVRDPSEQCDDGNRRNLDGCDAACRFEHTQRVNDLRIEFETVPGVCETNAFGAAFVEPTRSLMLNAVSNDVTSGAVSILFHFDGLDDPEAADDAAVDVGVVNAQPILGGPAPYDGNTSVDWWYAADPAGLGTDRLPLQVLPGQVAGHALTAGPGHATVRLFISGQPADFAFSSLLLAATTGAASTPATSTGTPPGHEALEHLDPSLQTFARMGQPANPGRGSLCGNVSAASLAEAPVPLALLDPINGCLEAYTEANSFLDLLVGGCHVFPFLGLEIVHPSQPDAADADAGVFGAGPPYSLGTDPVDHRVDGCFDAIGTPQPLGACLQAAAFSTFFTFTTHRVVAADDAVFEDGFESGTLQAWSAANTDGGDLTVAAPAIVGAEGLRGEVDDTAGLYVQDERPGDEGRYRARFYFDPSAFDPGEANGKLRTRMFIAFEEAPTRRVVAIVLRRQGGAYSVMARVRQDDDSQADTGFFPINAGPHRVEFEWVRSSGPDANDGHFQLWLDGASRATLTGLDNSISGVDFTRMGALSVKAGAAGTLRWDAFKATRRSPLGP